MKRFVFTFAFILFLVQSSDVWARMNSFTNGVAVKQFDTYIRPGSFRSGITDKVWEAARNPKSNRVHDPGTGRFIGQRAHWDMGHKPGFEFYKLKEISIQRRVSRSVFLGEYNNPVRYRPELPSTNRSHRLEAPREVNYYRDVVKGFGKNTKFSNPKNLSSFTKLTEASVSSVKNIKYVAIIAKGTSVLSIAGGTFGIGYGGYAYYTTHQRYLAGELDWDIAATKKALAVGHVIIGSGGIAVGVLLLSAPEPVFTKIAGSVVIIAGVTYVIVDFILDNYLERIQAKRTMQRQKVLAEIDWNARQSVCTEQLRKMIQKQQTTAVTHCNTEI